MASLIFNWKRVEAEVFNIVAPVVQKTVLKSSTLLPHVSN